MTLSEILKDVCKGLKAKYYYLSSSEANAQLTSENRFPIVLRAYPNVGNDGVIVGSKNYTTMLYICCGKSNGGATKEKTIKEMARAERFVTELTEALRNDPRVTSITASDAQGFTSFLSSSLIGVSVQITISCYGLCD